MRILAVVVAVLVGTAGMQAQESPVVQAKSKTEPQANVDLAQVGLAGALTATRVTIAPGTMNTHHTHTGRAALLVIIQGPLTEVRDSAGHAYNAGDVVTVADGVSHHVENHGTVPAVYVEINVTPNRK